MVDPMCGLRREAILRADGALFCLALACLASCSDGDDARTALAEQDADAQAERDAAAIAPRPLIDIHAFAQVALSEDPFRDLRPDVISCEGFPFGVESEQEPYFELSTELCNYLTVAQPSLADVHVGDSIAIVMMARNLTISETGEGFVGLRLGDQSLLSETLTIPTGGAVPFNRTVTASISQPAGAPVYFHVHNHGTNSWRLTSIEVTPAPD